MTQLFRPFASRRHGHWQRNCGSTCVPTHSTTIDSSHTSRNAEGTSSLQRRKELWYNVSILHWLHSLAPLTFAQINQTLLSNRLTTASPLFSENSPVHHQPTPPRPVFYPAHAWHMAWPCFVPASNVILERISVLRQPYPHPASMSSLFRTP